MACPHTPCTENLESTTASRRFSGVAAAARTIDELLFVPGTWRGLASDNTCVPGVRPLTLDQALRLVGRGQVATVFGRLRPGVVAVDVDMARGDAVVADLVAWCVEAGRWHVVRRSGRPGHAHVLIVVGEHREQLVQFCDRLRSSYRVSRSRIDVREQLRPLSAPHRLGSTPPLPSGLARAARALPGPLRALPSVEDPAVAPAAPVVASLAARPVPRSIRLRDLPADWADYFSAGIPPAQVAGWADASRSAVESTATWQMAAAGWSADKAWLAITQAHPRAFSKARTRGRRWWTATVWNRAVDALTATPPPPALRREPDDELRRRITAHRAAWTAVWTSRYPDPRRHTLRRVFDVLLDRMTRSASPRVPCPQRDLVLDTGLSRPTVAGALEELARDGWIVLERSFDPGSATADGRSHHALLTARPPVGSIQGGGLSSPLPPSSSTPQPPRTPPALQLASHLGPRLWHLYLALQSAPTPTTPADVASLAGWATGPLSARTARTVAAGLTRLGRAGLAECDEHGQWTPMALDHASETTRSAAQQDHQQRQEVIDAERTAYARVRDGRGSWERERQAALHRGAIARQLGARRWWESLDPVEQAQRRRTWAQRYQTLAPVEQAQVKTLLAQRRQLAGGLSEDQLHETWTASLGQAEYHARSAERSRWFRSLDLATQRELVARWEAHRERWGIQRRPHSPTGVTDATTPAEAAAIGLLIDLVGARPHPNPPTRLEESA
ncbi:MAG: hypothetical protein MUF33_12115 [Candidatus Nanopelagicales bacterium]|nr:hypothetical protein [Candidatus Nanopelagicales bacterium]